MSEGITIEEAGIPSKRPMDKKPIIQNRLVTMFESPYQSEEGYKAYDFYLNGDSYMFDGFAGRTYINMAEMAEMGDILLEVELHSCTRSVKTLYHQVIGGILGCWPFEPYTDTDVYDRIFNCDMEGEK